MATIQRDFSQDVTIAKRYFYAGFLGLPMLWMLSAAHYWSMSRDPAAPAELKKYVMGSLIGSIVMTIALAIWVTIFQLKWEDWGQLGRDLLVVDVDGKKLSEQW